MKLTPWERRLCVLIAFGIALLLTNAFVVPRVIGAWLQCEAPPTFVMAHRCFAWDVITGEDL